MIKPLELAEKIISFSLKVKDAFKTDLETSFVASSFLLSQKSIPDISNISEDDNKFLKELHSEFKSISYDYETLRLAFSYAYLNSLKEKDKVRVSTTPELSIIYLKEIVKTLYDNLKYEKVHVINPYSNNGVLTLALKNIGISDESLLSIEESKNFNILSKALRDLSYSSYEVLDMLPIDSYRFDILVSDPFLDAVEDLLIFFEDYNMYANLDAFIVVVLNNDFIRSRVFSDMIQKYKYALVGVIEYPKDLLDGALDSSIVILHNKLEPNKEFFRNVMPSVKEVDKNIENIKIIKDNLVKYLGDIENENNVN